MDLPHNLQQDLEQWVKAHGISVEEFIREAVIEKLTQLQREDAKFPGLTASEPSEATSLSPRLRRQAGILVIDVEPLHSFDSNTFIEELREERIQEQMAL
jgi:Arc/MetJ-type ribon-helix-helix transcriptional regulator